MQFSLMLIGNICSPTATESKNILSEDMNILVEVTCMAGETVWRKLNSANVMSALNGLHRNM